MDETVGHHCGLFGIYGSERAAWLTYLGLFSLQHRGQESAGIAVSDGHHIESHKDLGLVSEVFHPEDLDKLHGHLAVGHVRYSTTGASRIQNVQPLVQGYREGTIAVAHNGNLVNAKTLRDEYEAYGSIFHTSTDSEILVHLLADPKNVSRANPFAHCLNVVKGAYSFLFLTKDQLIGARDPQGYRPLVLGKVQHPGSKDSDTSVSGHAWVLASETCAFDQIGATVEREILPGEMVTIDASGPRFERFVSEADVQPNHCIFEHVYFARPDSRIFGDSVHAVRVRLGMRLAQEHPAEADIVIGIPDGGNSAALGYSRASGIPLEIGFIRNHYVGRTFIMPTQEARVKSVSLKLNVIKEVVRGKRVVVVEDSIVRGTTTRGKLSKLQEAGAREIHMRVASPPIRHPCFYGIDFPTRKELIAAGASVDEIRAFLRVDSLGYLSVEGLLKSVSGPNHHYCNACWTGTYAVPVTDDTNKFALETDHRGRERGRESTPLPAHSESAD